jgi:putative transposase
MKESLHVAGLRQHISAQCNSAAEVLPLQDLHGLSTGDFVPALAAFFGSAAGLSAAVITRLVAQWQADHEAFSRRDLTGRDYVYVWADGVHFRVRLEQARLCCLVVVGVPPTAPRSWSPWLMASASHRQLGRAAARPAAPRHAGTPVVAVGDGALGLWAALRDVSRPPTTSATGSTRSPTCSAPCPRPCRPAPARPWWRSATHPTVTTPSAPSRSSRATTGSSGPRPWPRSPTTPRRCCASTVSQPSTGCTCAPATRWSPPSRRSGYELE